MITEMTHFWPDRDEKCKMEAHYAAFQSLKTTDVVLSEYLESAPREKDNLMMFSDIVRLLRERLPASYIPSVQTLSSALPQLFQAGAVDGRRGWYVRVRQSGQE